MLDGPFTGGCRCGAIRYEIDQIFDVIYCHCSKCRPLTVSAMVAGDNFRITRGAPHAYATSATGSHHFCETCGSGLYSEYAEPDHLLTRDGRYFSVNVGSLDHPENVRPQIHQFIESKLNWLKIDDDLPRVEGNKLPHPDKRGTILRTDAGQLAIARAGSADYDTVMAILRKAADWLAARGNPQWKHWRMEIGEQILRDRLEHHEVFLARRAGVPVGTLTIQWSDPDTWGDRGVDGLAGYIHAVAITRDVGGMRVGECLLEWAVDRIIAQGRRLARLDAIASNAGLCRYYEQRGFRPLGTATLFGGIYTARLFERELLRER